MLHEFLLQLIFWIVTVVYTVLIGSIPYAIVGRGNRMLWFFISPFVVAVWAVLGGLLSLALQGMLHAETVAMITNLFYLGVSAALCVTAAMFRDWRANRNPR